MQTLNEHSTNKDLIQILQEDPKNGIEILSFFTDFVIEINKSGWGSQKNLAVERKIKQLQFKKPEVVLFILNTLIHNMNNIVGYYSSHKEKIRESYESYKTKYLSLDNSVPFYHEIKRSDLKCFLPENIVSMEGRRRVEENFAKNAKTVVLDEFSFVLFKEHIKKQKKNLTSTDVLRYINKQSVHGLDDDKKSILLKYYCFFWNELKTPSIALSKYFMDNYTRFIKFKDYEHPFAIISEIDLIKEQDQYSDQVYFTYSFYLNYIQNNMIPFKVNLTYYSENDFHKYITNIPRKNTMYKTEIKLMETKLLVLIHAKNNIQFECPYFDMEINTIISELKRDGNVDQIQIADENENNALIKALDETSTIIKEIKQHEQNNNNDTQD